MKLSYSSPLVVLAVMDIGRTPLPQLLNFDSSR